MIDQRREKNRNCVQEWLAAALVIFAMLLGGGGTPNPSTELALQLISTGLAALWLWYGGRWAGKCDSYAVPRWVRWIVAIVIAIPALQLMPLPPAIWQALPGREVMLEALKIVEAQGGWRPLTISISNTAASLLSLGPPLIALMMVSCLSFEGRQRLLVCIAGMGTAAALLGAVQIASEASAPRFYDQTHVGVVTGFHANRNAAADMFLIALLALAAWTAGRRATTKSQQIPRLLIATAMAALIATSTVLTGSRTGIALLALVALAAVWMAAHFNTDLRTMQGPLIAGSAFVMIALAILLTNDRVWGALSRFNFQTDFRAELWRDGWAAVELYWPVGSGVGTASLALEQVERFEIVDKSWPNRVHNDYLELLVEAGLLGAAAFAAIAAIIVGQVWKSFRRKSIPHCHLLFAIFVLVVLAVHSILDYPLRSMALAVLAGVACGMLARPQPRELH